MRAGVRVRCGYGYGRGQGLGEGAGGGRRGGGEVSERVGGWQAEKGFRRRSADPLQETRLPLFKRARPGGKHLTFLELRSRRPLSHSFSIFK